MSRTVILHYHLFKNAGTSLDEVLKQNFGERWVTREFQRPRADADAHGREVARWIVDNPEAVAFSSHTMELPPPDLPGVTIIPLIFVRHPIDRIASAYHFEHKQDSQSWEAVLARHTSMTGYCEVRMAMPGDRQCRNFQTWRFERMFAREGGLELERSLKAVNTLPFVGIVEQFDASMMRLNELLQPVFPEFHATNVVANVSRGSSRSLDDRLAALRIELGDAGYEHLMAANADDLLLYQAAVDRVRVPE